MRALLACLMFCVVWGTGQAQDEAQDIVESAEADETFLTIYPDNLAMVTEVRRVTVPEGRSTIRFMGVSDQMIARSAVLQSFDGISLESNFDTDLMTKGALLNKAVGQTINIMRINPGDGEQSLVVGKLISASKKSGSVYGAVFETPDGMEALECAGLPESLLFSNLPDDLYSKPVLSMVVEAEEAGEKEISLSYLSSGISWAADYRLDVDGDAGEGPLFGWLTLTNSTSKSFKDVPTNIIAGQVNRNYGTQPDPVTTTGYAANCWPKGSTKTGTPNAWVGYKEIQNNVRMQRGASYGSFSAAEVMAYGAIEPAPVAFKTSANVAEVENFADYKLYRVPRPITVAALQTKQIAFLDEDDAEYERIYKYNYNPIYATFSEPQSMRVEYEIDNSKDGQLGVPLPEGTMRVMTSMENGKTAFLGESRVRDLAVDLPVEIPVSESIGVMLANSHDIIEKDGQFTIRLQTRIMNSVKNEIHAEIKIFNSRIRYPDITEESHPRRDGKIIPTYTVKVGPESAEDFYIDIPVEQSVRFEHLPRNYVGKDSYSKPANQRQVNLPGQSGDLRELSVLMQGKGKYGITVNAQLNEKEAVSTPGLRDTRLDETFTFTNRLPQAQKIQFTYQRHSVMETVVVQPASTEMVGRTERMIPAVTKSVRKYLVDLVSASIDPDNPDELTWNIEVPANGSVTLDVVTQGQHRLK